jgi:hypothetical protein
MTCATRAAVRPAAMRAVSVTRRREVAQSHPSHGGEWPSHLEPVAPGSSQAAEQTRARECRDACVRACGPGPVVLCGVCVRGSSRAHACSCKHSVQSVKFRMSQKPKTPQHRRVVPESITSIPPCSSILQLNSKPPRVCLWPQHAGRGARTPVCVCVCVCVCARARAAGLGAVRVLACERAGRPGPFDHDSPGLAERHLCATDLVRRVYRTCDAGPCSAARRACSSLQNLMREFSTKSVSYCWSGFLLGASAQQRRAALAAQRAVGAAQKGAEWHRARGGPCSARTCSGCRCFGSSR